MPSYISIWTNNDTSEGGPTVDEERVLFTVEPVGLGAIDGPNPDTGIHLVTDGAHGLWTILLRLSPSSKTRLLSLLGADPSLGELGLPFTVAGSVLQAIGQAVIDRGNVSKEDVVQWLGEYLTDGIDDSLWDDLGKYVDRVEDSVRSAGESGGLQGPPAR